MLIAVMSDKPDLTGIVPEVFEDSPYVLVIETDTGMLHSSHKGINPADNVSFILDSVDEAVVCSEHITQECFEPIAGSSITRYNGKGMEVIKAAILAEQNRLKLVTDYEGGNGCNSGGECHEHN